MEHKIVIEILIKTDKKEEEVSKVNSLQINPEMLKSVLPQLMEGLTKILPKEKSKAKKKVVKK